MSDENKIKALLLWSIRWLTWTLWRHKDYLIKENEKLIECCKCSQVSGCAMVYGNRCLRERNQTK